MAKDAVATMGTILTPDVGGRDAVHVAVISVEAKEGLIPGAHIELDNSHIEPLAANATSGEPIGIVDPFLTDSVKKGERFWLYLYPRTITSLRHNWTHPAFEDIAATYMPPATKLASEQWLHAYLDDNYDRPSYDSMIRLVNEGGFYNSEEEYGLRFDGQYLYSLGRDAGGEIDSAVWHHLEIVTGKKITQRPAYFTCSC